MKRTGWLFIVFLGALLVVSGCNEASNSAGGKQETGLKEAYSPDNYIPYQKNGKWGLMDNKGKLIFDGEKENLEKLMLLPNSQIAKFTKKGAKISGYLNAEGKDLFSIEEAGQVELKEAAFNETDTAFYYNKQTKTYGIVDHLGTIILEAGKAEITKAPSSFWKNGTAVVTLKDGKKCLVDKSGIKYLEDSSSISLTSSEADPNVIVKVNDQNYCLLNVESGLSLSPEMVEKESIQAIFPFEKGKAAWCRFKDGSFGIVSSKGKITKKTLEKEPRIITTMGGTFNQEGLSSATLSDGETVILNEEGKIIKDHAFMEKQGIKSILYFTEDGSSVAVFETKDKKEQYGLLNKDFKKERLFSFTMDYYPYYLGDGLIELKGASEKDSEYEEVINQSGKIVLSSKERKKAGIYRLNPFEKGLSIFETAKQKSGLIAKDGKILLSEKENIVLTSAGSYYYSQTNRYFTQEGKEFNGFVNGTVNIGNGYLFFSKKDGTTEIYDQDGKKVETVRVNESKKKIKA